MWQAGTLAIHYEEGDEGHLIEPFGDSQQRLSTRERDDCRPAKKSTVSKSEG